MADPVEHRARQQPSAFSELPSLVQDLLERAETDPDVRQGLLVAAMGVLVAEAAMANQPRPFLDGRLAAFSGVARDNLRRVLAVSETPTSTSH